MNSHRAPIYVSAPHIPDNNLLKDGRCPISGERLGQNVIEFIVNDKKVRVCSRDCMIRVKNIYNYLR
jgi:hypothetical protein